MEGRSRRRRRLAVGLLADVVAVACGLAAAVVRGRRCATSERYDRTRVERWTMKGAVFGPCNCDWGCPCNFDVAPSYGNCDGVYVYWVEAGRFGDVGLDGLKYAMAGSSPGAVHEGNMTSVLIVDVEASEPQRDALEELWKSGEAGLPFDIWNTVTSTWLDTLVAPIEIELDGMRSRATIDGGRVLDLTLARVKNPVTGEDEITYLDKPTGFTSKRTELGTTEVFRLRCADWDWDYSGKYGEVAEYEYSGP